MADKYPVVCICGSTRFERLTKQAAEQYTLEGFVVLMVNVWSKKAALHDPQTPKAKEIKAKLDDIHKQKIRMADIVFVVNKDGYIGESTKSEIEYATQIGKPIIYFQDEQPQGSA